MSSDQDTPNFDTPGGGSDEYGSGSFAIPSDSDLGSESISQEIEAAAAELPADAVALKGEIENILAQTAASASEMGVQSVESGNIVGVGYSMADAESMSAGLASNIEPGKLALTVFTVDRQSDSQLQAEIAKSAGTRALSEMPIIQIPVGIIEAQPHHFRLRPAPGGVSVGHYKVTAGTLGCLAIGLRAPRTSRLMILSNNHVLSNSNDARLGDCICQPGSYDGGKCPADQIAILEKFIPINFSGGINYVDCATGWAWPDRVRRELVYVQSGQIKYFRIGGQPIAPTIGLPVGKSGRTTQLTQGRITAIGVSVNVSYGNGRVAHFRDQFAARSPSGNFSGGGDSGSVVWHWAAGLRAAGLLFAGGGGYTFCNDMRRVVSALDIRLFT